VLFATFLLVLFGTFLLCFRLCCSVHFCYVSACAVWYIFGTFPLVLFGTFFLRQCVIDQESALSHVNEL